MFRSWNNSVMNSSQRLRYARLCHKCTFRSNACCLLRRLGSKSWRRRCWGITHQRRSATYASQTCRTFAGSSL